MTIDAPHLLLVSEALPVDVRIVGCEACGTEGRLYERCWVYERNAAPHEDDCDTGPCPWCDGTGGEIINVEPIELDDLETAYGSTS